MKTVLQNKDSAVYLVLYMAIELSQNKWKLGFSNGERNRIRTIDAKDWICLLTEIEIAKQKINCSSECRVLSCYEAG
jgi:transposase